MINNLSLDLLKPFKDHPFKITNDEEMNALKKSIEESGVLVPVLTRPNPNGDGYELIAGHRRLAACRELGKDTIPVIVRDLTDDEAVIAMVDTNLQREHISPSEKAFAYKMKLDAMKRQGKRTDLTLSQVATKLDAAKEIGMQSGESRDQVFRFIRLTNLIPEILQMVDAEKIAITPAVELSYLNHDEQVMLFSIMECDEVTPSLSQAQRLRRLSEEQGLSDDTILAVMSELKGNQKEYVKIELNAIKQFFPPGTTPKEMQETMLRAMEFYRQHLNRIKNSRDSR